MFSLFFKGQNYKKMATNYIIKVYYFSNLPITFGSLQMQQYSPKVLP